MAYKQLWGTPSPGHIVYLVDLSGSMEGKIDYTINALSLVLKNLVGRCVKGQEIRPRLTCSVIGYNSTAQVIWDDMPIMEIAKKVVAFRKNGTPIFDKDKEFKPQYQTFMRLAFDEARKDIEKWMAKQKAAGKIMPAPVVINITDGYPYEGESKKWEDVSKETLASARALMNISTPDGNVRLFNIHHDPQSSNPTSIFPSQCPQHPAEKFLYEASSVMDEDTQKSANAVFKTSTGARCMVSNEKDPSTLVSLIEFGSTETMGNSDGSYF